MAKKLVSKKSKTFIQSFEKFKQIADKALNFFNTKEFDIKNYHPPIEAFKKQDLTNVDATCRDNFYTYLKYWAALQGKGRFYTIFHDMVENQVFLKLAPFQKRKFLDIPPEEKDIRCAYKAFILEGGQYIKNTAGSTILPKILHLTCPCFFIPIDGPIRSAFDLDDTYLGYIEYVEIIRAKLSDDKQFKEDILELSKKYEISPLYVIDKYCWVIANSKINILDKDSVNLLKWW